MQKRTCILFFLLPLLAMNGFGQPASSSTINRISTGDSIVRNMLDAIVKADEGLTDATENVAWRNNYIYNDFDKFYVTNPNKVRPWKQKADSIRKEANDLYYLINSLKIRIVKEVDPNTIAIVDHTLIPEEIKNKDNIDVVTKFVIGANNNGAGKIVKERIALFRSHIIPMVDKMDIAVIESINKSLNTSDPKPVGGKHMSWEAQHFAHQPLIAVITILSKLQNDVRIAEFDIVQYLLNRIDASSFKYNKIEPIILPNTNYVLRGTEYKAQIFLAAIDSTQTPTILVDGKPIQVENGHGNYIVIVSRPGIKKWGGVIQLKSPYAPTIERRFGAEYRVAETDALIAATKMNVFYLGVDNPLAISIPGVTENDIYATITNGMISKSGRSFVVRPKLLGKAMISVFIEIDGKKKPIGSMDFTVKEIPDPVAKVGGKKGGIIEKNDLLAQQNVVVVLEDFDFAAKFTITEFTLSVNKGGIYQDEKSNSLKFTEAQKDLIRNLNSGDRVTFTDIKAMGPDGKIRDLNGIILKIQ